MQKTLCLARLVAVMTAFTLVSLSLVAHVDAKPRKVYLNGEDLGDVQVRNHVFKGCSVRFDAAGNVYITAPNLEIKTKPIRASRGRVPVAKALSAVAKFGRNFYVVSRVVGQGTLLPYRFKVFINGKQVARIDPSGVMAVHTITRLIRKGTNTVRVVPEFRASSKISRSSRDRFVIIVGAGAITKGTVTINNPVVNFQRHGGETGKFTKVFRFTAR